MKPDRARVIQVYEYEKRERGKSGAYRRTGELLGVSDETVRRYVQAAMPPEEPPSLVYVPPPFANPEPVPPVVAATEPPQAATEVMSTSSSDATDEDATRHTPEPAVVPVAVAHVAHSPYHSPMVAAYLRSRVVPPVTPVARRGLVPLVWEAEYRGMILGSLIAAVLIGLM